MEKLEQCVQDVIVIATAFGGHDLAEAKRRIEILFADADEQAGGHFVVAQRLRDRLGLVRKTIAAVLLPNSSWIT
jgi:hypothetical protein